MLGWRLNAKKSVLSPVQRTSFFVVWDSVMMRAALLPACVAAFLTGTKELKLGQSNTVKQFERLLGFLAAASNVITFYFSIWPAVHETFAVVAQDQRVDF